MSDMSFKQAKELAERLEFAEVSLSQLLKKVDTASKNFETTLSKQEDILHYIPTTDKNLTTMKIIVAVNIGFVLGLLVSKYLL